MLTSFLIFLGVSIAAVTLLDFYMSEGQKKRLNDRVVRIWNWLDEAKRVPLLDMARTRKSQRILLGVAICAVVLQYVAVWMWGEVPEEWRKPDDIPKESAIGNVGVIIVALIIATILIWIGRGMISIMLRGKTVLQLFIRASLALLLLIISNLLLGGLIIFIAESKLEGSWFDPLVAIALGFSAVISGVLWLFWAVSAGLVLFIYLGSLLLYIVELTVRRIAEYPKGAVLAVGTLLGVVGALIKGFKGG